VKERESVKEHQPHSSSAHECIIARSAEELDQVYRLRYACYRRKESIDAHPDERFEDPFDQLECTFNFLVRGANHEPLATVRISVVNHSRGWTDSPAQHVYGDHPELQRMSRESYVEASRLCFGPNARRDAFVRLLGNMAALADFHEVGWLVACPREEHAGIYQRMFGFRPLASPRQYYGVKFQTQLLGIRRTDLQHHVRDAKPMLNAWTQALLRLAQSAVMPAIAR
jgi:hypothetical protein